MSLTIDQLSKSCENVLNQIKILPGNVFIENKQEDFLSTLVTIELNKQFSTVSPTGSLGYFITQYSGGGVTRADIAEILTGSQPPLQSHMECKYFFD